MIVWITELSRLSLVTSKTDPADKRRTVVSLTGKGRKELLKVRKALVTMEQTSAELLNLAGENTWQALWAMERGCREQPFLERLQQQAAERRK